LEKEETMVLYTSLYVHLLDQYVWGLLSGEEIAVGTKQILLIMAEYYQVGTQSREKISGEIALENFIEALEMFIMEAVYKALHLQ
jgi:uncharacterized membrane protein